MAHQCSRFRTIARTLTVPFRLPSAVLSYRALHSYTKPERRSARSYRIRLERYNAGSYRKVLLSLKLLLYITDERFVMRTASTKRTELDVSEQNSPLRRTFSSPGPPPPNCGYFPVTSSVPESKSDIISSDPWINIKISYLVKTELLRLQQVDRISSILQIVLK